MVDVGTIINAATPITATMLNITLNNLRKSPPPVRALYPLRHCILIVILNHCPCDGSQVYNWHPTLHHSKIVRNGNRKSALNKPRNRALSSYPKSLDGEIKRYAPPLLSLKSFGLEHGLTYIAGIQSPFRARLARCCPRRRQDSESPREPSTMTTPRPRGILPGREKDAR